MVCHAAITLIVSKLTRICHMFLFRLLKMKIMSKSSSKDSPQNVDEDVDSLDPVVCNEEVHLIDRKQSCSKQCMLQSSKGNRLKCCVA